MPSAAAAATERSRWQRPVPRDRGKVLGGVAGGIADEIGVPPLAVRVAFVVLASAGFVGALLYLCAWAWLSIGASSRRATITHRIPKGLSDAHRLLAIGLITVGLLLILRAAEVGFYDSVVWPLALFGAGIVVANEQGMPFGRASEKLVGTDGDRTSLLVRVAAGGFLVTAGVVLAVSLNFDLQAAWDTLVVVAVVIAGLSLVLGPWMMGLVSDLTAERRARIRSDERAEVAAHLHDSVLQTLSLIQRRADDAQVVSLARRQERELRSWLYGRGDIIASGDSFRASLETVLADVEALHAVPVEVVVVGDGAVDDARTVLLAATREAVANASVHAGAPRIDVYAEVEGSMTDVFIRDTGKGFDPATVPEDRRGIADSIRGRVERAGGSVVITSEPGHGTEIELHIESHVL